MLSSSLLNLHLPILCSGSTAGGIGDNVDNDGVEIIAKGVKKGAEIVQEILEEERKKNEGEESDEGTGWKWRNLIKNLM